MCFPWVVTPSVGTICLSSGDLWGFIGGIALFLIGMFGPSLSFTGRYNLLIFAFHPAFRKGNRKITDDPTASYTSGENVIVACGPHALGDWKRSEEQPQSRSEGAGWCFEAFAVVLFVVSMCERNSHRNICTARSQPRSPGRGSRSSQWSGPSAPAPGRQASRARQKWRSQRCWRPCHSIVH